MTITVREDEVREDGTTAGGKTMAIAELEPKLLSDLHMVAGELGIKNFRKYSKQDLIMKILNEQSPDSGLHFRTGLLDILPGRLRLPAHPGLHAVGFRHLRVAVADPPLQAAPR